MKPPIATLNMKKIFLIPFIIISTFKIAVAQDFDYGTVSNEDLEMKTYSKDTSAHAVVLREFGKTRIAIDNGDDIKLYFDYHVKIKILDEKGFDNGTVKIPVYNNRDNDSYENVDGIKGITYYTDDAGNMQQVELEQKKIYPEKVNKHLAIYKFAMPGLKKGCIIEYRYTIASPYWENLHTWEFQSDIPKMYSEYEVHIPAFWVYNASLKGALKLTKSSGVSKFYLLQV